MTTQHDTDVQPIKGRTQRDMTSQYRARRWTWLRCRCGGLKPCLTIQKQGLPDVRIIDSALTGRSHLPTKTSRRLTPRHGRTHSASGVEPGGLPVRIDGHCEQRKHTVRGYPPLLANPDP